MNSDFEAIKKDLNKNPIEGVSGNYDKEEILKVLGKYNINENGIQVWGTGKPRREFLHSFDLANACAYLMENVSFEDVIGDLKEVRNTHINIGVGEDISIFDLAQKVKSIVGYDGEIQWDDSKPDGTFQKLLNVDKLNKIGWKAKIEFDEGIKRVYEHYCS
jgi:GDP-L-fucose synthase